MTGLLAFLVLAAAAVGIWLLLRPSPTNPWEPFFLHERRGREQAKRRLREAVSEEDRVQQRVHAQREGRL